METKIYGAIVDDETRCIHYHTPVDIIAIKFKCCNRFYPCYKCHEEAESHPIVRWGQEEFGEKAIYCGRCKSTLSIREYMNAPVCPRCGAKLNSRCKNHYHIYFDVPEEGQQCNSCSQQD